MVRSSKMATLLPLVSDTRLIIIRPKKEPMGKIDWMMILAHCMSQYKPKSAVIVKSTATINYSLTQRAFLNYVACLLLVYDVGAFWGTMEQRVHVNVGGTQKYENSFDPSQTQQNEQSLLIPVLTACELKSLD